MKEIMKPAIEGLKSECGGYKGILYAGLMIKEGKPSVLEFNCRFGDPETQPILMRMKGDIVTIFEAIVEDKLDSAHIDWDPGASVCVVMASGGYPGTYEKGKVIEGLEEVGKMGSVMVFHAGTKLAGNQILTNGGRVLGVTALGKTIQEAKDRAYNAVATIQWEGAYFRKDIADKAIEKNTHIV